MADLSVTAANVHSDGANAIGVLVQAGEAITAGQVCYLDTGTSKYNLADCTTSAATATAAGIALTAAAADEAYFWLQTGGPIDVGATLSQGRSYYLSTAGLIMPHADIAASDYITFLGIAATASQLNLAIRVSGVQAA